MNTLIPINLQMMKHTYLYSTVKAKKGNRVMSLIRRQKREGKES